MNDSLFSQSWYRVASLKPRLRSHVEIHRHTYRGANWYILKDHSTGQNHRFSSEAYRIIGLMDGRRTLDEIWQAACAALGDDMPTQSEVIGLLAQLHRADVLQSDILPDLEDLAQRSKRGSRNRFLSNLRSPMAMRFPVLDPDRFLQQTLPIFRPFIGWFGGVLWSAVVVSAVVIACQHWEVLTNSFGDQVLSYENLFLIWLLYPVIKVFHEFGHAYLVRHWGGEVHEMGIMVLVLMPIPYVDASGANSFRDKDRRMIVSASGILVEVFLAALALIVWVYAEPGVVHALAYNVMLIAGVSTLLFNGNPLLRYDGYYVLADAIEIPNLGSRGNRYLGYLAQRYALGIDGIESPAETWREAAWLGGYSVTSFVYRMFIALQIAIFIAGKFFFVGVVLAIWALIGTLVLPIFKIGRIVRTDYRLRQKRSRVRVLLGGVAAVVGVLFFVVPLPFFTLCEGVVHAPDHAQVNAGSDGVVTRVLVASGQPVRVGDALIQCEDVELPSQVTVLQAQLAEYEARYRLASSSPDRTEADILKEEIVRVEAELARALERLQEQIIRSPADGIFMLPNPEDFPGRFVRRGTPAGHVVDLSKTLVRVVVPQASIDQVRQDVRGMEARLAGALGQRVEAKMKREVPVASGLLPSLALSTEGGGKIALDPREKEVPKSFVKLFQFEILLEGANVQRIGERVFVRFEHSPEPVGHRWYRNLRRLFLTHFNL